MTSACSSFHYFKFEVCTAHPKPEFSFNVWWCFQIRSIRGVCVCLFCFCRLPLSIFCQAKLKFQTQPSVCVGPSDFTQQLAATGTFWSVRATCPFCNRSAQNCKTGSMSRGCENETLTTCFLPSSFSVRDFHDGHKMADTYWMADEIANCDINTQNTPDLHRSPNDQIAL